MAGSQRRSDTAPVPSRPGIPRAAALAVALGLVVLAGPSPRPALAEGKAGAVSAEPERPNLIRTISRRQGELRRMGAAMRVIGRFLKSEGANVTDVGASAEIIQAIAAELPARDLFPEGTAIGVGRSAARPEIWQEWDIFRERASALQSAAARLAAAATTGNAEAVRAPILAVAQACGACHELFRRRLP